MEEMTSAGKTRPAMPHGEGNRMEMLKKHHQATLWVYWTIVLIGVWLIVAPLTFGFGTGTVQPAGGRSVWLPAETRATLLAWSDIISGLLLVILGYRALRPNRPISLWAACFVGIWLNLAPVFFWAPTAVAYLNDTLAGTLIIALTILIPGMPNMVAYMKMGPDTPPGWSYNPSSWPQRSILVALGFGGWLVSRYLAAYQLGYIDRVWDPFFEEGSRRVLTSSMSESLPISDAGLGAVAYTFEFLMAWMGGPARWRTMPWMVTIFGILVIPLGLVHILLVISQPVLVGSWCFFCLAAAALMLPMIPLEGDEVIAMVQFVLKKKREGKSVWSVFWKGGTVEGEADKRTPQIASFSEQPGPVFKASLWGMTFSWTLGLSAALGIWFMAAPAALGISGKVAAVNHVAGALIVTVSIIAMGEPFRLGRFLNMLLTVAVLASPWIFSGATTAGSVSGIVVGLTVFVLSVPRGTVRESFGSWDRFVA